MAEQKGPRLPSVNDEILGYGGSYLGDEERPRKDTVLLGHPEAAGIYRQNYDDKLEGEAVREDLRYVSPDDLRRRAKGGY